MKIGDLFIKLGLKKDGFDKGIDDAKSKTTAFGGAMKRIGGMIAGVFAVSQITSFIRESIKVAAETENVRKAFIRLGGGEYFNDLNNAVRGTISQVDLMKNTIQATNFGIPIKDLANLFKFATERAAQTGQSVEYLTQSIVMGIGRKSVLILDNLGISAVQLREKLKKVGEEAATVGDVAEAIGTIAQEQFKRMGEQATTTAQKIDNVSGSWVNVKTAIGDAINQNTLFIGGLKIISDYLGVFSAQTANSMTNAANRVKEFMSGIPDDIASQKTAIKSELDKINNEIIGRVSLLENDPRFARSLFPTPKRDELIQEINTLKNQAIQLAGIFDQIKVKEDPRTVLERISDLETLISIEKKLASQKNISFEEAKTHSDAIKKAEEELKSLREVAGIEDHKTAVQKLADLKAINDELEAQRILSQEFRGEKISPIQGKFTNSAPGDLQLGLKSSETTGVFGNLDDHYKKVAEKRKQFTDEELKGWTDFTQELNDAISQGLANAIGSMAEGLGQLAAGEITSGEFGAQILQVIGQFMQTLGGLFLAYGIANLKFVQALSAGPTPLGAGLAIAAGIGLIAAGSAISSFAEKGLSGGSSSSISSSSSNYKQSSAVAAISGNVVFELDGYKLKGALNNADRRNTLIR